MQPQKPPRLLKSAMLKLGILLAVDLVILGGDYLLVSRAESACGNELCPGFGYEFIGTVLYLPLGGIFIAGLIALIVLFILDAVAARRSYSDIHKN